MAKGTFLSRKRKIEEKILEYEKERENNGTRKRMYLPSLLAFSKLCLTIGTKIITI